MNHLDELESQSIYILREAFNRLDRIAMLWSLGKDSNVMVWLARKAFFGTVPFPLVHVDTGKKFPEMYDVRNQPPEFWDQFRTEVPAGAHLRIHPLLHWTEIDVWRYSERERIPMVSLYFAKDGKRYRSLGDQDITSPIPSDAKTIEEVIAELTATKIPERSGRAMDHEREDAFERLRAAGYM
jgi:3'-phosphoadenosine 5'-phosphosulfate sulfotransferase (PAPS reductase)/FAD synthetase